MKTIPTRTHVPTLVLAAQQIEEERKKPSRYRPETYRAMMNLMYYAVGIQNCQDEISKEGVYKHDLKRGLKILMPHIEKILNEDYAMLWSNDEFADMTFKLEDGVLGFIKELHFDKFATCSPSELTGFMHILKRFHENPKLLLAENEIFIHGEDGGDVETVESLKIKLKMSEAREAKLREEKRKLQESRNQIQQKYERLKRTKLKDTNKLQAA